jgi:hypothetical protein
MVYGPVPKVLLLLEVRKPGHTEQSVRLQAVIQPMTAPATTFCESEEPILRF